MNVLKTPNIDKCIADVVSVVSEKTKVSKPKVEKALRLLATSTVKSVFVSKFVKIGIKTCQAEFLFELLQIL